MITQEQLRTSVKWAVGLGATAALCSLTGVTVAGVGYYALPVMKFFGTHGAIRWGADRIPSRRIRCGTRLLLGAYTNAKIGVPILYSLGISAITTLYQEFTRPSLSPLRRRVDRVMNHSHPRRRVESPIVRKFL